MKNKKADAPILIMVMLILALSLFTLFQFSKNKRNIDTLTLDYGATDILYNREAQLRVQLKELAETASMRAYNSIMSSPPLFTEQGVIAELNDDVLNQEFKKEFQKLLDEELGEYIKNQGELKEEMMQIKEIVKNQPSTIQFKDNEVISLDINEVKITLISFDKQDRETFRGIYTPKIITTINLTQQDLSKASFDYFQSIYMNCKNEQEKIPCLNQHLPQFNMIFTYGRGYKSGTPQGTLTDPAPYNIEITYLNLTTKRSFPSGEKILPINFKVVVDIKEL